MLSCIKHACFHVFSPFSAYFFPHDIIVEKGLLSVNTGFFCLEGGCEDFFGGIVNRCVQTGDMPP